MGLHRFSSNKQSHSSSFMLEIVSINSRMVYPRIYNLLYLCCSEQSGFIYPHCALCLTFKKKFCFNSFCPKMNYYSFYRIVFLIYICLRSDICKRSRFWLADLFTWLRLEVYPSWASSQWCKHSDCNVETPLLMTFLNELGQPSCFILYRQAYINVFMVVTSEPWGNQTRLPLQLRFYTVPPGFYDCRN